MKPTVTVTFDSDILPRIEGAQFVCRSCCDLVQLRLCEKGCCVETWCPAGHPQILIRDGKVVGTSA